MYRDFRELSRVSHADSGDKSALKNATSLNALTLAAYASGKKYMA